MATDLQHPIPENELRRRLSHWRSEVRERETVLRQLLEPLPALDGLRPFS